MVKELGKLFDSAEQANRFLGEDLAFWSRTQAKRAKQLSLATPPKSIASVMTWPVRDQADNGERMRERNRQRQRQRKHLAKRKNRASRSQSTSNAGSFSCEARIVATALRLAPALHSAPLIELNARETTHAPCDELGHSQSTRGAPSVWADTRQELCEGLQYFRSYHSGAYGKNGFVSGYLIDGHNADGDRIGGRIIISHAGGKYSAAEGKLHADQTITDRSVAALMKNLTHDVPLVLIAGNRWPSRVQLNHRYNVLGWFRVTHIWPECRSTGTVFRVRFETLDAEVGWWAPSVMRDHILNGQLGQFFCHTCESGSPVLYSPATCLNRDCSAYATGQLSLDAVHCHSGRKQAVPPHGLEPRHIWPIKGFGTRREDWLAFHCDRCGKINCVIDWNSRQCSNCDSHHPTSGRVVIPLDVVLDPHRLVYTGIPLITDFCAPEIKQQRREMPSLCIVEYVLHECGRVYHVRASESANTVADALYYGYQEQNVPMRRRMLRNCRSDTGMLCQQFQHNAGHAYRFSCQIDTQPLDECAQVVRDALRLMQSRVESCGISAEFNQVLSIAYMERQKMDFHDDGERGVGSVVASISLGGSAVMRFRAKRKRSKRGACDVPEETSGRGDLLKLDLMHGDVCIMAGPALQRDFEHSVIPSGLFRLAVTARLIDQENV